jgi:hypothetical protein
MNRKRISKQSQMTSDKKITSNRRNAQKSTGPKSAAGKAIVSQNARTHGLLSRSLIIEGESQEEFSELLSLLSDEFQPVGLVEHALVERVGIALWRQRRLVRAESAEVSLNQQRFGDEQAREVAGILDLEYRVYNHIKALDDEPEAMDVDGLKAQRKLWQSFVDQGVGDTDDPFACLPRDVQKMLLKWLEVDAGQIDRVVENKFVSWADLFEERAGYFESLIHQQRIREVSKLVMQRQALPSKTDLLARYQTALDNDLYKALKALREAQAWRQAKALISITPVSE